MEQTDAQQVRMLLAGYSRVHRASARARRRGAVRCVLTSSRCVPHWAALRCVPAATGLHWYAGTVRRTARMVAISPLLALLAVLHAAPATSAVDGCDAPHNPAGCDCSWGRDETGPSTFRGLSHPPEYTPAQIVATGLEPAVLKAADSSAAACELVCCSAKAITDAPAAEQAPAQTGPCGTWQFLAPPAGTGCWLGLDPIKRPLPKTPTAGEVWVGGAINQGPESNWGLAFIIALLVGSALYVGGGLVYNIKTQGMSPGPQAMPHRERWVELGGLVVDGALFVRAVVQAKVQSAPMPGTGPGGGGVEKEALINANGAQKSANDYGATEEAAALGEAVETGLKPTHGSGSDDDDEELVE